MFELTKLSYSAISTFEGCQTDYFCNYILKLPQREKASTMIGTGVHKVLECICGISKQVSEGVKRPLVEDEYAGKVYKNTPLKTIVDRVYDKMVEMTPKVIWTDEDRKKYLGLVNMGLNSEHSPSTHKIIDVERYFRIELKDYDWAKINEDAHLCISGVIDVLFINERGEYCVLDYKTGKPEYDWNTGKKNTYKDYYKNTQLCMYYFALRKLMPDITPVIKLWYLQNDKLVSLYFEDSVLAYVEQFLEENYKKISSMKKPKQNRSWRCSKFCCWGKQTFSDIDRPDLAITNQTDNFLTKKGEEMTVCEAVHAFMKFREMDSIVKNCKKEKNERPK